VACARPISVLLALNHSDPLLPTRWLISNRGWPVPETKPKRAGDEVIAQRILVRVGGRTLSSSSRESPPSTQVPAIHMICWSRTEEAVSVFCLSLSSWSDRPCRLYHITLRHQSRSIGPSILLESRRHVVASSQALNFMALPKAPPRLLYL